MTTRRVRKGEIYWVDWNPARGSEQAGTRPSLIIQNDVGNESSRTTIVAGITTARERPYPFMVNVFSQESGLSRDSSINLSALLTVDKTRLGRRIGVLGSGKMEEVDQALMLSLGMR